MKKYLQLIFIVYLFSCNSKINKEPEIINFADSIIITNGEGWKQNSLLNDGLNIDFNYQFKKKLVHSPSVIYDLPLELGYFKKTDKERYAVYMHYYKPEFNIDVIGIMDPIYFASLNWKRPVYIKGSYLGDLNEYANTTLPTESVYSFSRSILYNNNIVTVNAGVIVYDISSITEVSNNN